ncbi:Large exoproteins involved in heme utilization or adhesion [hydrothermal vent metagenome]|uniref:Large exoproteins involved in heme utilization or adhesion n=1 Tax=hydrothermal vent metagenome TaxID=652676 RepID=A0A160TDG2_9ZZZZ
MAIINTTRLIVPILLSCLIAPAAFAESGRADYDLDDDGLIEINSLADLDEIRNNLDGTSLYGESTGCPEAGCNGFELTTTLDFDTNADGKMDENDAYWNGGEGWVPIGDIDNWFVAIFHGNNYQIKNMYIVGSSEQPVGLFGVVAGDLSTVRNLGLTGELVVLADARYVGTIAGVGFQGAAFNSIYSSGRVQGGPYVGGLVGALSTYATIDNSFSTSEVISYGEMGGYGDFGNFGGLAGGILNSSIRNSFATGSVAGMESVGGLVGSSIENGSIQNSFSIGLVSVSDTYGGGLMGYEDADSVITNSHWAIDTSGQLTSDGESDIDNYFGATLAELQCPTSSDDTECLMNYTLYPTWDSSVWDFGTSSELPGLIIDGVVYRDGDADGALDVNHAPEVAFVLTQNGDEVYDITIGDGDVTLEAVITDQDASDHHTLSWIYEDVTVISETETSVTFSSDNLIVGDYTISAVVTDNRFPVMSGNSEITFSVEAVPVDPVVVEPDPSPEVTPSSKSSGGGSMNFYWLMLISGFLLVGRRTVYCGITKI